MLWQGNLVHARHSFAVVTAMGSAQTQVNVTNNNSLDCQPELVALHNLYGADKLTQSFILWGSLPQKCNG